MARETVSETAVERIVRYLFEGDQPPETGPGSGFAATELASWLESSPRFRSFAELNRDKIRKKLRGAADPEARRDLRAELRTAHLLLADRGFELAFEAYGSGKAGPDFTAAFRGERRFNLEVTRMRRAPDAAGYGWTLLAKLLQLPTGVPNAVLISIEGEASDAAKVDIAIRALRARADRKDEEFFAVRGFDGARGFYDRFLRLGAVFVLGEAGANESRASLWINRSARVELPPRSARACLLALRAS